MVKYQVIDTKTNKVSSRGLSYEEASRIVQENPKAPLAVQVDQAPIPKDNVEELKATLSVLDQVLATLTSYKEKKIKATDALKEIEEMVTQQGQEEEAE